MDPGKVSTEIIRHLRRSLQLFLRTFAFVMKTPAEGSYTTLFCAVTPDLESGGYYRWALAIQIR